MPCPATRVASCCAAASGGHNPRVAEADVAVVKKFLAAMPEDWVVTYGDQDATERMFAEMLPLAHADFELHAPSELIELGTPAVADGPWFSLFGEWLNTFSTYREDYTEYIDAAPGVVLVLATIGGRTATGDVEIRRDAAAVYRLEDGLIRTVHLFLDRDEARAAVGAVPAAMIYDKDADLAKLDGKTVAILGYGSQGHAHALNLKDSGASVVVGLRPDSPSVAKAEGDGLEVVSLADAASRGDIVMILLPDERQGELWQSEIADGIAPGNLLMFAHGFAIHFGEIDPGPGVDVGMAAPKGPGHLVRRQYAEGHGVPGLVAVHQDASGSARDTILAYAKGIGCTRAGVIETTFKDETETDLFGEQAVLCGGVTELVRAGYETLVDAGYDPRMAYFECLHELKLIVDLMYEKGITGMRYSISNTAEYGDLTRGERVIGEPTREAMKKILAEIQSGDFAREWIAENKAGGENFTRMREEGGKHPIEQEGKELRSMMDWIDTEF